MSEGVKGALGPGPCPIGEKGIEGPAGPDALEAETLLEFRGKDCDLEVHNTSTVKLFIDRDRNRIGVKDVKEGTEQYYVPLSDVLDLLKRGVL